ncbi:MAG: outer membrane lipid asymmetry maintenance protein MlaD [Proteobacteria bacterium]|nr:outer membrane lipid asymmetry maintenance protein MlaD [Pseudomonadota bacterium]
MQKNLVETILGAVVLLVAGGFLAFFYKTTDIHPSSGYVLTAAFSQINGLDSGSAVRVSGVKVGQVLDFKLDPKNFRAIVRMNINEGVRLPKDTAAVIASSGLLDGKFMTLEPGSDEEFLRPGDQIEFTQSTPGLEQLLGQVIFNLNKDKDQSHDSKKGDGKPAAKKS